MSAPAWGLAFNTQYMTQIETKIELPSQSVLVAIGNVRLLERLDPVIDGEPMLIVEWDSNRPEESNDRLAEALTEHRPIMLRMPRSYPKGRRRAVSTIHAKGAYAYALQLEGSEEYQPDEKFDRIYQMTDMSGTALTSIPMPFDLSHHTGPFDLIGDVHGCFDELLDLLVETGHADKDTRQARPHPEGRCVVLLGDLTDRGPKNLEVLKLVRELEGFGALRVLGNHDDKLARWMLGRNVSLGLAAQETVKEFDGMSADEILEMGEWLASAQHHLILDEGKLIAAHAGIDEENQGRATKGAKAMALYGKIAGKCEVTGYSILEDWALDYRGDAVVVHGHIVHSEPYEMNGVVAVDTGCVFGGRLTAYHWPERAFTSVPARCVHYTPHGGLIERQAKRTDENTSPACKA